MKSLEDLRLDDFRLELKGRSLVPIMQGGMGVNISTAEMAQAVAARGGIGHVSDAMVPDLADRLFGTGFTRMKALACKALERTTGEAGFHFPVEKIREAAKLYLGRVMEGRTGEGRIHVNIMEKLTMNASLETLRARLLGALDAGVDGISLSAGLHAGSFALMSGHPRFRDACLGVVVSSRRALNLFMRKSAKTGRLPDYVVVEGPLAGGHLGFGADWQRFSLADIVRDVKGWLHENALRIPVIAAGGVFTGTDGVRMITEAGADGIQAATRFAVTRESGLPDAVKQRYFDARAEDIEVLDTHYSFGFRSVCTNKVVEKPADLNGLIMRSTESPLFVKTITCLGATPSAMSFTECLSAMSSGVVDGFEGSISTLKDTGAYEYTKKVANTNHFIATRWLFMAEDVYQSIPEKWRNILDECCVEAGKWEQENAENDEASMIEFLKDKGVEWNDVDIDAFTEACAPVYDWIVDEYGADPELHQKLVDFLNDYRAKNE